MSGHEPGPLGQALKSTGLTTNWSDIQVVHSTMLNTTSLSTTKSGLWPPVASFFSGGKIQALHRLVPSVILLRTYLGHSLISRGCQAVQPSALCLQASTECRACISPAFPSTHSHPQGHRHRTTWRGELAVRLQPHVQMKEKDRHSNGSVY